MFTDESEFLLHAKTTNKQNDVVWARRREGVPPLEVKQYSAMVRVWGGVSAQGHTRLFIYDDNMTGPKYLDVLTKVNLISTRYLAPAIVAGHLFMIARPLTKQGQQMNGLKKTYQTTSNPALMESGPPTRQI